MCWPMPSVLILKPTTQCVLQTLIVEDSGLIGLHCVDRAVFLQTCSVGIPEELCRLNLHQDLTG